MDKRYTYRQFAGYSESDSEDRLPQVQQQQLRRRRPVRDQAQQPAVQQTQEMMQRRELLGEYYNPHVDVLESKLNHVVDELRTMREQNQIAHQQTHEGVDQLQQGQRDILSSTEKIQNITEMTRKELKEGFRDIRDTITGSDCIPTNLIIGGVKKDGYEHGYGMRLEFSKKENVLHRLIRCVILFIRSLLRMIWVLHTVLFKIDQLMAAFVPEFTGILGLFITKPLKLIIHTSVLLLYVQVLNILGVMFGYSGVGWELFQMGIIIMRKTIIFTVMAIKNAYESMRDSEFYGRLREILGSEIDTGLNELEPVIGMEIPRTAQDVYNATGLNTLQEQATDLIQSIRDAGRLADTVISPVAGAAAATGEAIGNIAEAAAQSSRDAGDALSSAAGSLWGSVTGFVSGLGSRETHLHQDGGASKGDDIYTQLSNTIFNDSYIDEITILVGKHYPNQQIIESHISPNVILILESSSIFVNLLMNSTEKTFDMISLVKSTPKLTPHLHEPRHIHRITAQTGGKKRKTKQPYQL